MSNCSLGMRLMNTLESCMSPLSSGKSQSSIPLTHTYHIWPIVTGVLPVSILIQEAPSDLTFLAMVPFPIAFEASAFLVPLLHFFFR